MKPPTISRRMVLRGASGASLSLPFLSSLAFPRRVLGDPVIAAPPRFLVMTTDHGAIRQNMMFPDPSTTQVMNLYPGHDIHWGPIAPKTSGGTTTVSPVVSAASTVFTPTLLAKMNILRGLDRPEGWGHQSGSFLGNFGEADAAKPPWTPTVDQIMAWSSSFYPDIANVPQRSLYTGTYRFERGPVSYYYSNPQDRSSPVAALDRVDSSFVLFNKLFPNGAQQDMSVPVSKRKPLIDSVLADYQRLRNGNRRLSTGDKARLDAHIARISDLERSIKASQSGAPSGPTCAATKPTVDTGTFPDTYSIPDQSAQRYQILNDIIAAAFSCNATRIGILTVGDTFSDYTGGWHPNVIHVAFEDSAKMAMIQTAYQLTFEKVFLDLAAKLDAIPGAQGGTVLDETLMTWLMESGMDVAHRTADHSVVTFGSASGYLKTGLYIDYRNQTPGHILYQGDVNGFLPSGVFSPSTNYSGLIYHQLLYTFLQAMRVPASDYAPGGTPWYGKLVINDNSVAPEQTFTQTSWVPQVISNMQQCLPLLKA